METILFFSFLSCSCCPFTKNQCSLLSCFGFPFPIIFLSRAQSQPSGSIWYRHHKLKWAQHDQQEHSYINVSSRISTETTNVTLSITQSALPPVPKTGHVLATLRQKVLTGELTNITVLQPTTAGETAKNNRPVFDQRLSNLGRDRIEYDMQSGLAKRQFSNIPWGTIYLI